MSTYKSVDTIGRIEKIRFRDFNTDFIPAKVDTGADTSSVWASNVSELDNTLTFNLFDKDSPYYVAKPIHIPKGQYRLATIVNSFGTKERRYVVKLSIELGGRKIKASFSLSNRSSKPYPVLLGARLLRGKFLVDVSKNKSRHPGKLLEN